MRQDNMQVNWQKLKITQTQLDEILNFDLKLSLAVEIGQLFFLKQSNYTSLLIAEASGLFLVCSLSFPIILILFRNFNWLTNNPAGFTFILAIAIIISFLCSIVFNYYLWQRAKQLKVFAVLLDKVKQYNHLIDSLSLMSELNAVTANFGKTKEITELKTALNLTRNSLIRSIELEKIINRDRHLASNRDLLLANLESGLINLDSLVSVDTNDYDRLFSEAIDLGLSVHRELRKNHPTD